MPESTVQVETLNGRVIRWKRDQVGNDLTSVLRWCSTHLEPVWVYEDGSYECPHDRRVQVWLDDHVIVDAPWEVAAPSDPQEQP